MKADQQLIERWTRFAMGLQCKICGEAVFDAHAIDAQSDIEHVLAINNSGSSPGILDLLDALTWLEHSGKHCDYHAQHCPISS